MALQLESLYNFLILAESGSFTAAAARLYMTQQALSRQIAGLEQTLGKPLILRNQGQGQQLRGRRGAGAVHAEHQIDRIHLRQPHAAANPSARQLHGSGL